VRNLGSERDSQDPAQQSRIRYASLGTRYRRRQCADRPRSGGLEFHCAVRVDGEHKHQNQFIKQFTGWFLCSILGKELYQQPPMEERSEEDELEIKKISTRGRV